MKSFMFLIFVILLSAGTLIGHTESSVTAARPLKIFILAGQSNAVGYNNINEFHGDRKVLGDRLAKTERALFWPGTNAQHQFAGKWIKLRTGVSGISGNEPYKEDCFGPELGFVMQLSEFFPGEEIAVIKYAEGATGIAASSDYTDYIPELTGFNDKGVNWHPPVNGQKPGKLYSDLHVNISNALADLKLQGREYDLSGFLWMQGEHEAGISKKMAGDYKEILSSFIRSVRKDLGKKDLPFIVGEINSHTWAFGDLAREKQADACIDDRYTLLVKTIDLPRNGVGDKAHFDADGMLELGYRFAAGMAQLLEEKNTASLEHAVTFKSLLEELTDRTRVAGNQSHPFQLLQASSYERSSVEKDKEGWYANSDWSNYMRTETINGKEEYIVMDAEGPGAITRFWTGGHPNQPNHLRFYIDGNDIPFWEADHTGALIGQNKDIGIPLSQRTVDMDSLNTNYGAQPGHNLFAPIPFSQRLKITTDCKRAGADKGFWYNINYRIYEDKRVVEIFSKETPVKYYEVLRGTNRMLNEFMELSPLAARVPGEKKIRRASFSIRPGDDEKISMRGEGSIRRVLITLSAPDMDEAVKNIWLRMEFDGKLTVDVPAGFLFGCGDQLVPAKDWYRMIDKDGNMACFWVMPYQKNAVISLINKGKDPVSGSMEVATGEWTWTDNSLYFHTDFKRVGELPGKTTADFNFIDLKNNQGMYIGDILQVYKAFRGWWGEGDEKIYIDGSRFPDHFGTGSEDYYGYAWGHPEIFNNIFNGQPIGDANTGTRGTTVNSRVRSLDAIAFRNSLRIDMESWQKYGGPVNYDLACFWYGKQAF